MLFRRLLVRIVQISELTMGNILIVGETTDALNQVRSIISRHLKQANIDVVRPENALGLVLINRIALTAYVVSPPKKPDLGVISEIRSVSSKIPLLIYGDFDFSPYDVIYLLSRGCMAFYLIIPMCQNI